MIAKVSALNFVSSAEGLPTKILVELERKLESAVGDDPFISEACTPLLKGGKRLRPILFLISSRAGGSSSYEKLLPLAAAIELIHTASLVHDDILDASKVRRGVSTANAKYGAQVAVLIGDYLFAKAFQFVADGHYGDEVSAILSRLVKDLCIGEIKQDRSLFVIPTLAEYYERIELKTAIFLSSCCRLGALTAGLERSMIDALSSYGMSLGLAFQITDDLLDFFGDEALTGKKLGGDLKSGVITLPILRALGSEELRSIVTREGISDGEVERAIELVRASDALMYCRRRAEAHAEAARLVLPTTIDPTVSKVLEQAAAFIVDRSW